MTKYSLDGIQRIKQLMDNAVEDYYQSLCWYEYIILPKQEKYKTLIDGNLQKRIWWFSLRLISE
jgi:hypothetical protein